MKVLYVINNLYSKGNGLCAACRDNIIKLKERGIEVKVLSGPDHFFLEEPDFELEDLYIPIFNTLICKHGYQFSRVDKEVITEAVKWADVIHLEEPFIVQVVAAKIAKKLGKPCVATYHLHPENIFASIKMELSHLLNGGLLWFWKKLIYDKCKIVHCPSENVRARLEKVGLKAELRTFSNGLDSNKLLHVDKENIKKETYNIISIGRYAYEKDHKTIINALKYSKYKDKIKLTLAGRGPIERKLKRKANKLYKKGIIKHKIEFGFLDMDSLQKIAQEADLYIHSAFIEVEGLSCMEAIQTGLVPIIAEGKLTATSQFALSDNSKYKARRPKDLALKIDYWLSDDEARYNESLKYKNISSTYNIDYFIDEMIKMYEDAIES